MARSVIFFLFLFVGACSFELKLQRNSSSGKSNAEKYYDFTVTLEDGFKKLMKSAIKQLMPSIIRFNEVPDISRNCISALMKYAKGLTQAKLWAAKMLDASSKLPPGFLVGTFSDFGSFDECLNIQPPVGKNGAPEFVGSSCTIEAKPPLPPMPPHFTLVKSKVANDSDTMGAQFRISYDALHHKKVRLVLCIPSKCSLEDVRHIARKVSNMTDFTIKVPQCYTKEEIILRPVHVAVISAVSILFVICLIGTTVDLQHKKNINSELGPLRKFFTAFSCAENLTRLLAPSGGARELKCIHGIRALSMFWVILGHSYVLVPFDLLKEPRVIQSWLEMAHFEIIHNGWLAVETFFVLSGVLVSYGGMKSIEKVNGKLNIPLMALRRYIRLTPPVLLVMGLVFFLPLLSSGPFWYEQVDPQLESCRKYWWSTLLYISNWLGINKGCMITTWYLAVDFQLHVFSLILLVIIFRYTKFGLLLLAMCLAISCSAVGMQTAMHDMSPTIAISSTDDKKVFNALNRVHVYTFTHLGPHCVGMILGFYIFKHRERKMKKLVIVLGWCASVIITLSAIMGNHRFSTGEEMSRPLTILYASLHRLVFAVGVAWVAFACITGHGGLVNSLLSSSILTPFSRLTFAAYLLHPLVIWTRMGSLRERPVASHYDFIYNFLANLMISFAVTIPFHLLLEAPLSNIDRWIYSRSRNNEDPVPEKK